MLKLEQHQILPLKPQEIELIALLRTKYRFGTIEIIVRDGVPQDILKTIERKRLGNLDDELYTEIIDQLE